MGRHPEYRDAPVCSFEQGLEEVESPTYSSVISDRQDPEFDLELEEIARREWPVSPIVVVVPVAITISITLGLFFGIPAVFTGLNSKQSSATSLSSNATSVVLSNTSQLSVTETRVNSEEVKPIETLAGTTWSANNSEASKLPMDMKFAFFKDGTGKIETGGKNTPFIWEENKETHTVNAYGSATGAVAIPNGSNLDFKSATFDTDGVNLVMTSWEDSSGTSNLNVMFVQ